jgi:hypothetical protein
MANKIFLRFFITLGTVVVLCIGFLYFSYLDEKITEGSGYGLEIGMSREDIERYRIYKRQYISDPKLKYIGMYSFFKSDFNYDDLAQYDGLQIYFHEIAWDYIFMEFWRGKLIAIHRHRQYYELL